MKRSLLGKFERLPYFTIEGFRQIAGGEAVEAAHVRTTLYRWAKAGLLIALKRGTYMSRAFYERHRHEPVFAPMVSAILVAPSYLSLEYVLQRHGLLTEITYPVTAVTIKNTRTIPNALGTFVYRHIQPALYHGFELGEAHGVPFAKATAAKALFDYLYLRRLPADLAPERYNLAEALRLNLDELDAAAREEFAGYVAGSRAIAKGQAKMRNVLRNVEQHVWRR